MALSDYLASQEWNACFYVYVENLDIGSFGAAMHLTIQKLLENGYVFEGLDEKGNKKMQVEDGVNAPKINVFFGGVPASKIWDYAASGRSFLKKYCPELVRENDEEWEEWKKDFFELQEKKYESQKN